ncbi:MAG: hypothetical protein [Caudoviricetes sp.]|nr:MAG: hypothetical protein [Caudoviricetes sp.]
MNRKQFWAIENVSTFKGFDVVGGEVSVSDSEYVDYLDEIYGDVVVCGQTFGSGGLLQDADPVAFRCGKGEYEQQLDSELEEQLNREDSDDIEFIDGDEDDEDYDYGYAAFEAGEECDENESDDWVAGWHDAKNNKTYDEENPVA